MTTSDGNVIGTTLVIDHGSPARRWNLVILGDGYRQSDLGTYATDVQNFINTLQMTRPFNDFWNAINIYRVDVVSTDSGADDPTACGGTGATPKTYFDASFCGVSGIQRLLVVNNATAITVANQQVPQWDMIMVIVNSSIYGGSGGNIAVFSTAANANEIGMHEMGHTAFKLADEYEYYAGCTSGETGHDSYPGGEPWEPNVTIDTNIMTNKWRNLILASTHMPTTSNSNCTQCDPQPSPVPQGIVGTFEGAYYHHCGAYRPEFNCRMRSLNNPFCAVCQQIISQTLSLYLEPTIQEDCVSFNTDRTSIQNIEGRWKVVDGSHWILDFGSNQENAQKALDIIKHHRLSSQCFVGRPNAEMTYFLSNGDAPTGSFAQQDCIGFNPQTTTVQQIQGTWKVVDGSHWILDFGSNEEDAQKALQIIKKYNFSQICFVGRPATAISDIMMYFLSSNGH